MTWGYTIGHMNIDHFMHTYMITQTDLCYNYMYNILNTDSIINILLITRQINNNYKIQHIKLQYDIPQRITYRDYYFRLLQTNTWKHHIINV